MLKETRRSERGTESHERGEAVTGSAHVPFVPALHMGGERPFSGESARQRWRRDAPPKEALEKAEQSANEQVAAKVAELEAKEKEAAVAKETEDAAYAAEELSARAAAELRGQARLFSHMGHDHLSALETTEWQVTREQLGGEAGQAIDIGTTINFIAACLLWGHVGRCPDRGAFTGGKEVYGRRRIRA